VTPTARPLIGAFLGVVVDMWRNLPAAVSE